MTPWWCILRRLKSNQTLPTWLSMRAADSSTCLIDHAKNIRPSMASIPQGSDCRKSRPKQGRAILERWTAVRMPMSLKDIRPQQLRNVFMPAQNPARHRSCAQVSLTQCSRPGPGPDAPKSPNLHEKDLHEIFISNIHHSGHACNTLAHPRPFVAPRYAEKGTWDLKLERPGKRWHVSVWNVLS